MNQELQHAIHGYLEDGKLPCARAMAIAGQLGLDPLSVGLQADATGVRISRCQLGLFGYGPKAEGKHKIVRASDGVPEDQRTRLQSAAQDGDITCLAVWDAAEGLGIPRMAAAAAVEALGLRVSACQLGCFPRPKPGYREPAG